MNELSNEELKLKFSPVPNVAYLNDDGTVTVENGFISGTFNQGDNYVFGKGIFLVNGLETVVNHVPLKITVGTIRKGHHTKFHKEMSQAAYETILKADNMGLLNKKEIEYFDLEQKVFANQKVAD